MPMLERTAVVLEPCTLQRVLPSASHSGKKSRELRTSFWHHGSPDIELAQLSQALMPVSWNAIDLFTPNPPKAEPLAASPFLLDFLYPQKSLSFLRRFVPGTVGRYEGPRQIQKVPLRLYASSAPTHLAEIVSHTLDDRANVGARCRDDDDATLPKDIPMAETAVLNQDPFFAQFGDPDEYHLSDPTELRRYLSIPASSDMTQRLDSVWRMYNNLPINLKPEFQGDVLVYLSNSTRVTEAWRISEMFASMKDDLWEDRVLAPAIKAEIMLQNAPHALSLFKRALTTKHISAGIGALIAHSLRTSAWETLSAVWQLYVEVTKQETLKTEELKDAVAIPDLGDKLTFLAGHIGTSSKNPSDSRPYEALSTFLRCFSRECLGLVMPQEAAGFVRWLKDPLLYEDFIRACVEKRDKETAARAYREYRALPGVRVRIAILKAMVQHVFYPDDLAGMEQVMKDWYIRYGRLDRWAYSKFLAFYARRGDVASVYRLWNEFTREYPDAISTHDDTFTHLLNVHLSHRDLAKVQQTFDEIEATYNIEPNTACWNILLRTYIKAGQYDAAAKCFSDLCKAVVPDKYTFGTIMWASANRGDLDLTLQLYKMAQSRGIELTVSIVDSVVQAYCHNERFTEAEELSLATTKERKLQGSYSSLWNTLLHFFAEQRDLTSVHRVLNTMTELGLAYTGETYSELLRALLNCKQPHQALHLLGVAQKDGIFNPTPEHYVQLMAGFLRTREPHMALQVNQMMYKMGFRQSSERMLVVLNALRRWRDIPPRNREKDTNYLANAMREFYRSLGKDKPQRQRGGVAGKPDDLSSHFSTMMFLFTQIGAFASVRELVHLYRHTLGQGSDDSPLPLRLLRTLMVSDFCEGNHDNVKSTWDYIFQQACIRGRPAGPLSLQSHDDAELVAESRDLTKGNAGGIVPAWRYSLVIPLRTMYRLYTKENDSDSLIRITNQVLAEGFEIDNKGWNHYVQCLALMKRWKEAFSVCNQRLMPGWAGWATIRARRKGKNLLPLELRRLGRNPRFLRPISYTLIILAREYGQLEQLTPLSAEASRLFKEINEECPLLVHAIRTMIRTGSTIEEELLGDADGLRADGAEAERGLDSFGLSMKAPSVPRLEVRQPGRQQDAFEAAMKKPNLAKFEGYSAVQAPSEAASSPVASTAEVTETQAQEPERPGPAAKYPGFRKLRTVPKTNNPKRSKRADMGDDVIIEPVAPQLGSADQSAGPQVFAAKGERKGSSNVHDYTRPKTGQDRSRGLAVEGEKEKARQREPVLV
ncbi:uncharacterized protein E0L32_004918 [Thyridium curvatum]|uniref:Uncharacterized protein n=1 Tax=Thyridium curvatum TaxID=1093900 RepID=A0A507BE73_9PEZI|nr:uncharacterized protein E0L32_004918 [Thyridium curvatum]TPX15088.1 hypothetical protein E0L32_004918 [Thyridium curvatum]